VNKDIEREIREIERSYHLNLILRSELKEDEDIIKRIEEDYILKIKGGEKKWEKK